MKRLLLFDFDGVIADSLDVFARVFMAQCRARGFDRIATTQDFLAFFDGNFVQGLRKVGFHPFKIRRLLRAFTPKIAEAMSEVQPFDGMTPLLSDAARTHPTYVITSSMTPVVEDFLTHHGVTGLRAVLGADREPSKVKKIRGAVRRHPGLPAYYVGDTRGDMIEGREAGSITVAVTWGWHETSRLRGACPDHVVHTPDDLRKLLGL